MATEQMDRADLKAIVMSVLYLSPTANLADARERADVIIGLAQPTDSLVDLDGGMGDTPIEKVREPAGIKNVLRAYGTVGTSADEQQRIPADERTAPIGQDDDAYAYQTNFSTLRHARIKAVWLVSDGSQVAFEQSMGAPIVFEVQNGKLTQTNSPKVLAGSSLIRVL